MNLFDEYDKIEQLIKELAAKVKYNKGDFEKIPDFYKKIPFNGERVKKVFTQMRETDFCKTTEVDSCEGGRYGSCTCIKTVGFGEDDINGKICERFTTRATSSRCRDGNLELSGRCKISSSAFPCELMFNDKEQELFELQEINQELIEKLGRAEKEFKRLCIVLDLSDDCFGYLDL